MHKVFEETEVNGLTLSNRLARSATWEGMCEANGCPTEKLTDYYRDLAKGGIGLIITGYTYVRSEGKGLPGMMGIHTDNFAGEMKSLTRAVHTEGAKLCLQLVHTGGQTDTANAGCQPLAPSAVAVPQFPEVPAEMSQRDIDEVVAAFGEAARRAKEYGFDAVQLHAAHGFLINQFLSPLTNRRTDDYGGSVENRTRFLMEVYRSVRSAVGAAYPVAIKLNGTDNLDGGLEIDDAVFAARALDQEGIDLIEVSSGTPASEDLNPVRMKIKARHNEAYNLPLAQEIKKRVRCPVMLVGGLRSLDVIEEVIEQQKVDYCSLARPLIQEPDLPRRWQRGDRSPATCISCNGCFQPGLEEGGIYCVVDKNG